MREIHDCFGGGQRKQNKKKFIEISAKIDSLNPNPSPISIRHVRHVPFPEILSGVCYRNYIYRV